MKFRPCIDLHEGKVKQIVGSTLSDTDAGVLRTNFSSLHPPSYYASMYRRDSLTGGHVIMLGPGNEEAARNALAAYPGGLQIGGGITTQNAPQWVDRGAEAVIVTSYVFKDGRINEKRLIEMVSAIGTEHLVLDLSCRRQGGDYFIVTDRWQKFTDVTISEESLRYFSVFCKEFLIHAVDVEGKCAGIEEPLASMLGKWSPIPTTYAGGIQSIDNLHMIKKLGGNRIDATIGSALDIFGGSGVTYADAVAFNRKEGFD